MAHYTRFYTNITKTVLGIDEKREGKYEKQKKFNGFHKPPIGFDLFYSKILT